MRLTYIFHSGFVIETQSCILIFDYWLDPTGVIPKALSTQKPVYVFASHVHFYGARRCLEHTKD